MKVAIFVNELSLGGSEKAACEWGRLLKERGHDVSLLALKSGPRISNLERFDIPFSILSESSHPPDLAMAEKIEQVDVVHIHAPGFPHPGDVLGVALRRLGRRIPVVQTNIFGQLKNPVENEWTDFRLFISWTSCVQAARRSRRKLDREFFRRQSVAVYPLDDPLKETGNGKFLAEECARFRSSLGITPENTLFGRFSRPEPNKWTPLVLDAFLAAYRENPKLRLLLKEPPAQVAEYLIAKKLGAWTQGNFTQTSDFPIFLEPATVNSSELTISQMACDVILHTSSIGESFGYGLAEPMALGKPVITNSVPWHDQAQIELVRHGECGFTASTRKSMKNAILQLARGNLEILGDAARKHILSIASPDLSVKRLETALKCAITKCDNPLAEQDLEQALKTEKYLEKNQWGHSWEENVLLYMTDRKVRLLIWQHNLRKRLINSQRVHAKN